MVLSRVSCSALRVFACVSLLLAGPLACATGNTIPSGEGGFGEGGSGAAGGAGGMMAGTGGVMAGTGGVMAGSGGAGGGGMGGGGTGGAVGTPTKILSVFGGGTATIANSVDLEVAGSGFATPWSEQTNDAIGLASDGNGVGVCLIRSSSNGELRVGFFQSGQWTPGFAKPLPALEAGLQSDGGPSLAAAGGIGHAVYRGVDGLYYYARTQNKLWLSTKEAITAGGKQSSGPKPPGVAAVGTAPLVAFVGADQVFYDQSRAGGAWGMPNAHPFGSQAAGITPAITTLESGPEVLAVFVEATAYKLFWTTRKAGVWSTPAEIPNATSADPPVLAPLPGGGAVLAFRSVDQHLYTAQLSAGDTPSWGAAVPGAGGTDPIIAAPPAVARGAKGADVEMIYIGPVSSVYSTRLIAGVWTAPVYTGSASGRIAIATLL